MLATKAQGVQLFGSHLQAGCLSKAQRAELIGTPVHAVCLSKERRAELPSTLLHAGLLSKARHVELLGTCLQAGFCQSLVALAIYICRYQVFRFSYGANNYGRAGLSQET